MELISLIFTSLLLFFALYGFILVVAGSTHTSKVSDKEQVLPRIKILLPAYKPSEIFLNVLESLQKACKNYPIEVLILFQHADKKIVEAAAEYGFDFLEKNFDHLTGNSYRHALQYLCDYHLDENQSDYVVILDKDNLIDPDFFISLSSISWASYDIIQGVRKPLATSEGIQLFDAISERYNDLMLRKGKVQLGGVLEISGSAALIRTSIFKNAIRSMDINAPGYDKNFMVKVLTANTSLTTCFSENLIIYEEKTAEIANYQSQRLRWFSEQYFNAIYNAKSLLKATVLHGNLRSLDYFLTLIRPPRSLQLMVSVFLFALDSLDGNLGYYALPFLFNLLSFVLVAFPFLKMRHIKPLINGFGKIVIINFLTSVTSMKKKYQNTFIHTR